MELNPSEVYYNIYINEIPLKYGTFYVGNGNTFIHGHTYSLHGENDKIKLEITLINSDNKNNIDHISSNSYQVIDNKYYDTIEDAVNIEELLKSWVQYKDYKCNKKFIKSTVFKIQEGNLLNKIQYRTLSLVDYIIYNKLIKGDDMPYIPFSYTIREKINYVYNQKIFDMNEFNISFI